MVAEKTYDKDNTRDHSSWGFATAVPEPISMNSSPFFKYLRCLSCVVLLWYNVVIGRCKLSCIHYVRFCALAVNWAITFYSTIAQSFRFVTSCFIIFIQNLCLMFLCQPLNISATRVAYFDFCSSYDAMQLWSFPKNFI